MSELFSGKLLQRQLDDATIEEVKAEEILSGKLTALYFANSTNPNCAEFTHLLKNLYDELKSTKLEIVYLSDDPDEAVMLEHLKSNGIHWCFLPFGDPLIFDLIERYDLETVPVLMPIKPDGTAIDTSATAEILSKGKSPQDLMAKWESTGQ